MLTRRDWIVAVIAACTTLSAIALAQPPGAAMLRSMNFDWDEMKASPTSSGEKRAAFKHRTATLDQLSCHVTTVGPHMASHDPHRHVEEELIIVKEGTIESMQNGETTIVGPGSVIFEASNELHGLKNAGDTPATYYVIKFWPPGMLEASQ